MKMPSWIRVSSLAAAFVVLAFVPRVEAKGGKGGGHAKAPHMSAAKPHSAARSANRAAKTPRPHSSSSHANHGKSNSNGNKQNHSASGNGTTGTNRQNASQARNYANRRNNSRRYGSSSGYRRNSSNQATRAVVSTLRSAHSSLARATHDYKGHRVQAMHSINSAIRQLSHSSSRRYGSSGSGSGLSSFSGTSRNRNRTGTGTSGKRSTSQAASDALLRQAHQKLQSANSRLANLGGMSATGGSYGTPSHTRAQMHIQQASRHLSAALNVR